MGANVWQLLCEETNHRAEQDKVVNPNGYYCKKFDPVSVREMKAFFG